MALLSRTKPELRITQFVKDREEWFLGVVSKRDALANVSSSGTRRISLLSPPRSPSSPGLRIPLPPDYDDLPDTQPGKKETA
jgi:hypothetical protein